MTFILLFQKELSIFFLLPRVQTLSFCSTVHLYVRVSVFWIFLFSFSENWFFELCSVYWNWPFSFKAVGTVSEINNYLSHTDILLFWLSLNFISDIFSRFDVRVLAQINRIFVNFQKFSLPPSLSFSGRQFSLTNSRAIRPSYAKCWGKSCGWDLTAS